MMAMLTYLTNNLGIKKNSPGPRHGSLGQETCHTSITGVCSPHRMEEGPDSSRLSFNLHTYALDTSTHTHASWTQILKSNKMEFFFKYPNTESLRKAMKDIKK